MRRNGRELTSDCDWWSQGTMMIQVDHVRGIDVVIHQQLI